MEDNVGKLGTVVEGNAADGVNVTEELHFLKREHLVEGPVFDAAQNVSVEDDLLAKSGFSEIVSGKGLNAAVELSPFKSIELSKSLIEFGSDVTVNLERFNLFGAHPAEHTDAGYAFGDYEVNEARSEECIVIKRSYP